MRSVVVILGLAMSTYAATCTDGTTNVFTIADQNDRLFSSAFTNNFCHFKSRFELLKKQFSNPL